MLIVAVLVPLTVLKVIFALIHKLVIGFAVVMVMHSCPGFLDPCTVGVSQHVLRQSFTASWLRSSRVSLFKRR